MHGSLRYSLQVSNPQAGATNSLYARTCQRGQRGQLWAGLTGRSRGLLALGEVGETSPSETRSGGGVRMVNISEIQGSESRSADFDRDFNPLQNHTEGRWLSVAQARQQGKTLPPVALIQVGDLYFVRDGHHRLSVARALGQKAIEATVEVWQMDGPLPWGERSPPPSRQCADRGVWARTTANGRRAASILGWLSGLLRAPDGAAASQHAG
jgi:hypothetical protein